MRMLSIHDQQLSCGTVPSLAMKEPASTATLPPFATADRVDLVFVVDGQTSVQTLPDSGRLVIGRATEANVCVPHRSLSREHASITMPGLVVEDLGSTNGTFVRRAQPDGTISESPLKHGESIALAPGDSVRLGAVTVVLVPTFLRDEAPARSGDRSAVVVDDPAMRAIYAMIDRVAASDIPVLVLGETGVGKEVLAEALHGRSPRARRPLVRLNCAALSESLLESELFGHEKGAFTGASGAKPGLIETADGGTVLLDEIGDLPLTAQAKLLRVLEERKVIRVGGVAPRPVDVRFVAATHKNLEESVARGQFRGDLYFRLAGVLLRVPPLRERRSEIASLARSFVRAACGRYRRVVEPTFSRDALAWLESHAWPGNIRELRHSVERAVLLCDGATIEREHLLAQPVGQSAPVAPIAAVAPAAPAAVPAPPADEPAHEGRAPKTPGLTRAAIERALESCAGNQTRAAEHLGISRRTLVTWLERYKIARPRGAKG
jgi:two-component system, NtrC family, response regulator AtoC